MSSAQLPATKGEPGSEEAKPQADPWKGYDTPRIRHITGVRIHQLTLPESLLHASKLVHDPPVEGFSLGESSRLVSSPEPAAPAALPTTSHRRRSSAGSFPFKRDRKVSSGSSLRPRSGSNASSETVEPSSPLVGSFSREPRIARHRAGTLAGEALEQVGNGGVVGNGDGEGVQGYRQHLHGSLEEQMELVEARKRRLVRCFVVLRLLPGVERKAHNGGEEGAVPLPKRAHSDQRIDWGKGKLKGIEGQTEAGGRPSSTSTSSPSTPRARLPSLPSSPTTRANSVPGSAPSTPRTRTTSLTSTASPNGKRTASPSLGLSRSNSRVTEAGVSSPKGTARGSTLALRSRSAANPNRPGPSPQSPLPSPRLSSPTTPLQQPQPSIPFYISPIHQPSTHPRFTALDPQSDFASWLTYTELASSVLEVQVWAESADEKVAWRQVEGVGGLVRLDQLRRKKHEGGGGVNGLEFTLSFDPKGVYCLTSETGGGEAGNEGEESEVVERSMKETRMKKGVGVGGLHQLVNMHAVIVDTERGLADVQRKVDILLEEDVDRRALHRELLEREERVKWLREKVAAVESATEEVRSRISKSRTDLSRRRENLADAEEADNRLHGQARAKEDEIRDVESERQSILPQIYRLRASHIQTLDTLFPISPLDPSILLYTIINVPLPIPSGLKDPAPPLVLPPHKVDERTTAAALGYVAMVVQTLGNLGGQAGGLPYAITCAGSRSAVRDGVSVMQGPRSFPLYAKGVERYRYEYGVFLLNKDIEMLMQEANIRLLDLRQTLPNLKNLLLTLSSPVPPSPAPTRAHSARSRSGTTTNAASRASSGAWPHPGPGGSSVGLGSPGSSAGRESPVSLSRVGAVGAVGTPSPLTKRVAPGGRRSMLSRGRKGEVNLASSESEESDVEQEKTQVGGVLPVPGSAQPGVVT
ncbi:hypothetical protein IAT38_000158 [Cryptococcus sp. DSM 104549]